jgi:hypothetical protein
MDLSRSRLRRNDPRHRDGMSAPARPHDNSKKDNTKKDNSKKKGPLE